MSICGEAGGALFQGRIRVGALRLIGWLVLTALAPGAAHLKAGWRRTGLTLLSCYAALLLAILAFVLTRGDIYTTLGTLVDNTWLTVIIVAAAVLGVCWFAVIVHSFTVLRPGTLRQGEQIVTGTLAGLIAVAVLAPFALTAQVAWTSQTAINKIFKEPTPEPQAQGEEPPVQAREEQDPWAGRERVNILLLGGDADDHRPGVRTDSMHLASVDVRTGNTVLFSLPRNLEHVRFKPGTPMAERFPYGFRLPPDPGGGRSDLLNSVWEYADAHPEIFGGRKNQGPKVLMETIGHTLGLEVDWYALVNMWGFARLIDAIGGVTITVEEDVIFGRYNEGLVKAGTRKLKGADAMWYARSRTNSDDYTRMRRQRCVISALLREADPATVLSRFTAIAGATEDLIQTDIPRTMLSHLVPLALKVKDAKVTSVQFVPPLIKTYDPDWRFIRRTVREALRESEGSAAIAASATPMMTPMTPMTVPATTPAATPRATSESTPTPGRTSTPKKSDDTPTMDLAEGCGKA
jgi:LCP family protein required for cell wall assembly